MRGYTDNKSTAAPPKRGGKLEMKEENEICAILDIYLVHILSNWRKWGEKSLSQFLIIAQIQFMFHNCCRKYDLFYIRSSSPLPDIITSRDFLLLDLLSN